MLQRSALLIALLSLTLSSPALGAATSLYDPFHDVAKLVQRPPEPPMCCLKPLPSSEPAEEILSFEDWKAKQAQLQAEGKAREAPKPPVSTANGEAHVSEVLAEVAGDILPTALEPHVPSHFPVPLTDRFNYANMDCSARVHLAHRSAKSPSSILSSKKDRYMLSPCTTAGEDHFVVVELCDDIRIDTVQLANFEFFSGVFKDFSVSVARTPPTDPEGWTPAGTYSAKNIRGVQSFHPPTYLRDFYRYIRIDFHSHYGNEFYCPISLLRVYGLTHLEQWKREEWEEEWQRKRGAEAEDAGSLVVTGVAEAAHEVVHAIRETISDGLEQIAKPTATTAETEVSHAAESLVSPAKTSQPPSGESASSDSTLKSLTSESGTGTVLPSISAAEPASQAVATTSNAAPPDIPAENINTHAPLVSSQISQSNNSLPSYAVAPSLSSQAVTESSNSTIATSSSQSLASAASYLGHPSSSLSSVPASVPTIIPHDVRAIPTVIGAGESIYRTIMTRLSSLEANATLYLRYVEEQTRSMRDALLRLEEDVGRLEGIGKAQAQYFQKTMQDWDKQRKRLEREHGELLSRVTFLSDEVVLEKRLGIAQLCLLLTVLVFMALTRGSRGEAFIGPSADGRRDSLREWGRKHLSSFSSGEWGLLGRRTRSPTLTPAEFKAIITKQSGELKFDDQKYDFPSARPPDTRKTPRRTSPAPALPSSTTKHRPMNIRTPIPRHLTPRPSTPSSISFYGQTIRSPNLLSPVVPGSAGSSASTGRPRLRRSSSHNSPAALGMAHSHSTGASSLSAKRWAKSAHLHEIRPLKLQRGSTSEISSSSPLMRKHSDLSRLAPGGLDALCEQSPTKDENVIKSESLNRESDIFWPVAPSTSTERVETPGIREGAVREPLTPLQNRPHDEARGDGNNVHSPCVKEDCGLGSPWHPGGAKLPEIDTESESWVDTDVEGSDSGGGEAQK